MFFISTMHIIQLTSCFTNYLATDQLFTNAKQNDLKHCVGNCGKIKTRKANKKHVDGHLIGLHANPHGFCSTLTHTHTPTYFRVRCINYMKFTNKLRACKRRTRLMMFLNPSPGLPLCFLSYPSVMANFCNWQLVKGSWQTKLRLWTASDRDN